MKQNTLHPEDFRCFAAFLRQEERSAGTVDKYLRDAAAFGRWLDQRPLSRENAAGWKAHLAACRYAPVTINSMLAAVNKLFACLGRPDCKIKPLRIQRRIFREDARELTRAEFTRLVTAARQAGKERLSLILETICSTGIRVSELRYITSEAARAGRAVISLKGKIRTILLPRKLARKLLCYARKEKIASGELFLTRSGKGISRKQIWAQMKGLCARAGVLPSKVFPHNLRHLFARLFYGVSHDCMKLADILGHSSVETTRIYLRSTGAEHVRQMDLLQLIR